MIKSISAYRKFLYEELTLWVAIPIITLNVIEAIYVLRSKNRIRRLGSNLLLLSLALSDLLLGSNMLVLKVMHRFMNNQLKGNKTAETAYSIIRFGNIRLAFFLSTLNLTALTIDQYKAIKQPMRHRLRKCRLYKKACVAIWISAIIIISVLYLSVTFTKQKKHSKYINLIFTVPIILALTVFIYSYAKIYTITRSSRKRALSDFSVEKYVVGCTTNVNASSETLEMQNVVLPTEPAEIIQNNEDFRLSI